MTTTAQKAIVLNLYERDHHETRQGGPMSMSDAFNDPEAQRMAAEAAKPPPAPHPLDALRSATEEAEERARALATTARTVGRFVSTADLESLRADRELLRAWGEAIEADRDKRGNAALSRVRARALALTAQGRAEKAATRGPWVVRWVDANPAEPHDAYLLESGSWNSQRAKARLFDSYIEACAAWCAVRDQFEQFDDYDPSTHFVERAQGRAPAGGGK